MTFTYNINALTTDLAKVRRLIGDVTADQGVLPSGANLADEEIAIYTAEAGSGNVYAAAALCCHAIATAWSIAPDTSVDGRSEKLGDRYKAWMDRAKDFERKAARGKMLATGISVDRKDTVEDDTDRIKPAFTRDLDRP